MDKGDFKKLAIAAVVTIGLGVFFGGGIYQFKSDGKVRGVYTLNKFTGSVQYCLKQSMTIRCLK